MIILIRFQILLLLLAADSIACEETGCADRASPSEYTWNPSNAYVTPRLNRFYELNSLVEETYYRSDFPATKRLIDEYLELAAIYPCNWNYGNAVHDSNRFLGLMSVASGDVDSAEGYLEKAGKSPGSPQLNSFGPELDLANELLTLGKKASVVSYLRDIRRFWSGEETRIDEWISEINSGELAELGRFTMMRQSKLDRALNWIQTLWPLFVPLAALVNLRNSLRRKLLFLTSGVGGGYLIVWFFNSAMIMLVTNWPSTLVIKLVYAWVPAVYLIPLAWVYFLVKSFTNKDIDGYS